MKTRSRLALSGALCSIILLASPAFADSNEELLQQMKIMQKQIAQLQKQLAQVQKKAVATQKASKVAAANPPQAQITFMPQTASANVAGTVAPKQETKADNAPGVTVINKNNIKLMLGGFIEAAAVERTRNETADIGSSFIGIPFPNSSNYHVNEFRGTSRQSRLSLLAQGTVDPDTALAAYFETDFLGAGSTANSNESNSYNLRMRQIYATMDRNDIDVHLLGGQAWSLVTLNKVGITPRQENVPLTIDAQYVPGFNWTRNTQMRIVKAFDEKKIWAGLSLESPQSIIYNGPNAASGGPFFNNPGGNGGSGFASVSNYSLDLAPDIVAKLAFDPGYGHYEVYGLGRFFRDRSNFHNNTIMGGGAGAGAILPLIDKKLDFQISGLAGTGVGRYGSAQLPDITIKPTGNIATVDSWDLLAGLVGHPTDQWDLYTYAGTERAKKKAFTSAGLGYGYGSPLYNNSGCLTEGVGTCIANTSAVDQITAGFWWKFYKGSFGTMQLGLQDSYTTRDIFTGVGGSPSTDDNITMVSFRYYPF